MPSRVPIHIESTVASPSSSSVFGMAVAELVDDGLLGRVRRAEVAVGELLEVAPELRRACSGRSRARG